ncbi:hypothetical protein F8388_001757 [Cannabis sativa]|uniref:non-specific serine/threonine protein kinase n=1 Tax=Cannabis sativa TaxID=3483 RepID=A0A7J6F550_CANSA|nr:hypothetical protein F8388_001757 [Cannabis sativa]
MDGNSEQACSEIVEVDPTGRYGRYNEILGKGASKTVYRAFDEYEGIEVAWNQVKLYDFLQNPEDLERLYSEIHLLKTLKHKHIMKFYTSWVDTANRNINFVTEMFTSGTLRQYRLKHRRVNIRAVKHWCRQILKGLLYLHSRNPPVIHRDLKCDNIFINGNQGEVKIGDLGLAAILRKSHAAHCVGTPEFMAPEVYEEEYNELVDIYAFGMCILEMVTFEYPYSECTHPAQIYKKVISGKKPEALYKVKNPEVRQFVEKCLATVSCRFTALELLKDPFLQVEDYGYDMSSLEYETDYDDVGPFFRQPHYGIHHSNSNRYLNNGYVYEPENDLDCHPVIEYEANEIDLFSGHEDEHVGDFDITIKGRRKDGEDGIFLRLRIADKEGRIRNIYFPFDIENDTASSVATEMVNELDITDQDVIKIADMIDNEIAILVPEWKRGLAVEENKHCSATSLCHNCDTNGSIMDYVTSDSSAAKNLQVLECSKHGSAAIHGRFEEITYQVEGSSEQCLAEGAAEHSRHSQGIQFADIWAQRDGPELHSQGSKDIYCDDADKSLILPNPDEKEEKIIVMDNQSESSAAKLSPPANHDSSSVFDDYENDIRQELRWLKAKYQMQMRGLKHQQLRAKKKPSSLAPSPENLEQKADSNGESMSSVSHQLKKDNRRPPLKTSTFVNHFSNVDNQNVQSMEAMKGSWSPDQIFTAKSFYSGSMFSQPLHRATSLPVDAIDA